MTEKLERRGHARKGLDVPSVIRVGGTRRYKAVLLDLSEKGCALSIAGPIPLEDIWSLKIEGLDALRCSVQWRLSQKVVVEFVEKLHPAVVDHFCQNHPRLISVIMGATSFKL